jgi:putative heme-binding domain-containing protein
VAALRLILDGPNVELLRQSLAGTNAVNVAQALGNTGENRIVPLLSPMVTDTACDLVLRKQAVRALAQVQAGAAALLKLAEEQKLSADLTLTASTALKEVRWDDLRARAAQILPAPQGRDAQPLPPVSELVKLAGDPVNGAAVFRRDTVACNKCHQVNGEGVDFGPGLSEIGTKLGKDALYEAILNPSAGISFGFEAWQINLKNGDEAYGLLVSETADELAIKAAGGIVTRYKKGDIATRAQQKVSIMPAGLQQAMSRQDLVDLVEYLSSLRKAVK